MLGLNAVDVYAIDAGALAPLVERIGPRVSEVHGEVALQAIPLETVS